jgi:uroporphyrinogen decarboxylase
MNTRIDNILKMLRREGVQDKIPVDFELCETQVEKFYERFGHRDYPSYFGQLHRPVEIEATKNFVEGRALFPREELPADTEFDVFGVGHSKGSELAYHMTRMHHPLKGADMMEIESYPYPSLSEKAIEKIKREINYLHDQDLAAYAKMQMTIWEAAWYLRSMEELMMDMLMEDEKALTLLDKITDFACNKAEVYARAGADVLGLGDDIGTQNSIMIDKDLWKRWLQPRLKKVIDTARDIKPDILIFYHSCGYVTPFIDDLIHTGIDILNPVQPECMDFNEIHDEFGDRVSFWGTIGTQQLLPFGTSTEVYKTVTQRLEKCGKKGGIVIGPTHLVEPEVPWENLLAIKEAVNDFEKKGNL